MEDTLYKIIMDGTAIHWLVTVVLLPLIAKYVIGKIHNDTIQKYVGRVWTEIQSAVAEVYQTFVAELKEANKDGKLTAEEKAIALKMALDTVKSNIGMKGLERLMRILGLSSATETDSWITNKIEAAIDASKKVGTAAASGTAKVVPSPLP